MTGITEELIRFYIRKHKENLYLKGKNKKGQIYSYLQVLVILMFETEM
jgi:hypothetical protein